MLDAYDTETIEQHGTTYRVDFVYDTDMGAPWEEHDGHGEVSEWTTRAKRPGERVLNQDRRMFRYYDIQASIKKAKREQWGNYDFSLTKGQMAAEAVERDFEFLRAWCNDHWHWMGIVVTEIREDRDGFIYDGEAASLWGISSQDFDKSACIQDLIGEIEYANNHRQRAA